MKPWKPAVGTVVHVGGTVKEIIDESGCTQRAWAQWLGITEKHLSRLVTEQVSLSAPIAVRIERQSGVDADLLMTMQAHWEVDQARVAAR